MSVDDHDSLLPTLKDIIKVHKLSAQKNLGQNFLLDMNLLRKIARMTNATSEKVFLEVGAGPGGLSRALLAEGIQKLYVIEKDPRCIPILEEIKSVYNQKLEIIQDDALKIDFDKLFATPYHIATNLPYNISSDFITTILTQDTYPKKWQSATMMLQKEFALRMQASSHSKEYGRLSVLCALTADVKILFDVHPSNFTPPPKVMSSIVQIIPKHKRPACDLKVLEKLTRAAFGQRRKMLRTSLKQVTQDPEGLCIKVNIDPTLRADHLSPMDYLLLCQNI